MGPSLCPSSVAVLSTAAYEHQCFSSTADEEEEDDEFEFRPLLLVLPQPGSNTRTAERARAGSRVAAHARCKEVTHEPLPSESARRAPPNAALPAAKAELQVPLAPPRKLRWHHMAFGSVRVPSAMDMGDIRRRLKPRQALAGSGNEPGWAPWRLIRSLSCKGVEAVAVAAAAAPVRLV